MTYDVIVIGGGFAGLTAARDLSKKGATVTVIDARSRVGGRVLTRRDGFLGRQHAEAGQHRPGWRLGFDSSDTHPHPGKPTVPIEERAALGGAARGEA